MPLIVRGPGVPSNMTTDALALNIDLVRTAQQGLVSSSETWLCKVILL